MRRATLLAVFLFPGLAAAQTTAPGPLTFAQEPTDAVRAPFISIFECNAANGADIFLAWTVTLANGHTAFPSGGRYTVYASTAAHPTDANQGCTRTPPDTNVKVGIVGATFNGTGATMSNQLFEAALFPSAIQAACTEGQEVTIYVCVEGTVGAPGTTVFGTATGTLTLSTTRPLSPSGLTVKVGDGALILSWTAPASTSTPAAYDYRVVATAVDPNQDGTIHEATGVRDTSDYRLGGLANGVPYTVEVFSVSEAGNESLAPASAPGTPAPVDDFWDLYARGPCDPTAPCPGREEGGCGTGGTGALALLAAAALLAVLRRRA